MSFASTQFLVFFAALFLLYYTIPQRYQWKLLLVGSLIFYWFAGWWCLIYIGATTVTVCLTARKIDSLAQAQEAWFQAHRDTLSKEERKAQKARDKSLRFRWLLACLLLNFGILAVVKYTNFVLGNVNAVLALFGSGQLPAVSMVLPMGISFYTFQTTGYLIDVYWGKVPAQRSLGKFALFATFFPQLIQGPISRYGDLSRTLYGEHPWNAQQIAMGAERVLWGLAKKLIVADRLAIPLRTLVSSPEEYSGVYVLAVIFLYAVQLYADFTGGIDITIGAAQMLGVQVTENFVRPFFSKNAAEYWRRWHITMGTWFRDYLFYPMSVSKPILKLHQRCRNRFGRFGKHVSVHTCSLILWFVTGVWHGASWNFIVWGLLNGIVIIVSQEMEPLYDKFHARFPGLKGSWGWDLVQVLRTFWLMGAIRVLDVYRDVPLTFRQLGSVVTGFRPQVLWDGSFLELGIGAGDWLVAAAGGGAMLVCSLLGRRKPVRERLLDHSPHLAWGGCVLLVLLTLIFGVYGIGFDATQFIYNQF